MEINSWYQEEHLATGTGLRHCRNHTAIFCLVFPKVPEKRGLHPAKNCHGKATGGKVQGALQQSQGDGCLAMARVMMKDVKVEGCPDVSQN